jgi:hypothetical protein
MDEAPHGTTDSRGRLRRPTIVQAPILLVTLIAACVTAASVLWSFYEGNQRTASWWAVVLIGGATVAAGPAAIRGCFIEVRGDRVRDVVAWITVHRFDRDEVASARVARGVWRLYVVELEDGSRLSLLGASPQQWPARLVPGSRDQDLGDLDILMGGGP